jgi:hypothetical protein
VAENLSVALHGAVRQYGLDRLLYVPDGRVLIQDVDSAAPHGFDGDAKAAGLDHGDHRNVSAAAQAIQELQPRQVARFDTEKDDRGSQLFEALESLACPFRVRGNETQARNGVAERSRRGAQIDN